MLYTRTKKIGNAVMVSIPEELHPAADTEYLVVKSENGSITLVPKMTNPFKSDQEFEDVNDISVFEEMSGRDIGNEN